MTKRRDADRMRPPLPDTPPDRDAVERAIASVLDRLRPKPAAVPGRPPRPGTGRKTRPRGEGA